MKHFILFASITLACGLLFTNLYSSLIDAKSWGSNIPNSIGTAREYFKAANPGQFYRLFSPINQLLGLIVLILFWRSSPSIRICFGAAFAMYVLAEGLTFMYFFPRNDIMFRIGNLTDIALMKKTWSEWNMMNWVRTAVLVVGVASAWIGVHKLYSLNN